MRLTTFTDYALRVLMHVAGAPGGHATIAEVARVHGISEHHLVKVVHRLGKAGFLHTTRGHGGGLRLARAAESIGVGDVVRLCEGESVLAECFTAGGHCAIERTCSLAGVLQEADSAFYAALDCHTLRQISRENQK